MGSSFARCRENFGDSDREEIFKSQVFARCRENFGDSDREEIFKSQYTIGWLSQALGSGSFSKAYRCWKLGSSRGYAMKAFESSEGASAHAVNEIMVLEFLGRHPRITHMVEYDMKDLMAVRVVLELCEGGQLFDRIRARGFYEEPQAALVVRQVLEAVAFLHSKGVMHRDMKLENVLLVSRDSDTGVRVCDFGLAKLAPVSSQNPRGPRSMSFRGSNDYLAPEMIRQEEYGCEVDIWAVGVMSYAILSGTLPFTAGDLRATYQRIVDRELTFDNEAWERASSVAVTFVSCLLTTDVAQRPKAAAVVQHQWIVNACASSDLELEDQCDEDEEEEAVSEQSEDDDDDSPKSVVEMIASGARLRCINC